MGAEHENIHNDHEHHDHDHEHHHHGHNHGASGVEVHVGHKAAALCIMAVATLAVSCAPIYVRRKIYKKSNSKRREVCIDKSYVWYGPHHSSEELVVPHIDTIVNLGSQSTNQKFYI